MNRLMSVAALLGAIGVAGCASGPMMAGVPGQMTQVARVPSADPTPNDPALCVAAISKTNIFSYLFQIKKLRSFTLLTEEHPDTAGCDLVLRITIGGATVFATDELQAYSAYGGDLLWQGASSGTGGKLGTSYLLDRLIRDFSPGQPARAKLDADKATGRHVAKADLERAGFRLLWERDFDRGDKIWVARAAATRPVEGPRPLSSVAATVAAPAAASVRSDVDELPAARPESAHRHAVVIGVERYRETLPRADFAAGDAKLAAEYFKRVLGVPEANLALLVDDRATKSDFEKYFERWLPNRVEAGDEVFVYFSGHGAPNPKSGDAYLVPFDGDPTYIAETGYPIKKLYDQLAKLPAKRVLVAMDSCFSGAGGRSVIAKGARPLVSVRTAEVTGRVSVMSASAGDQISSSYQEKGHGLFTYFLLKGLKDKGGDFKAAFDYLKPEVSRIARREYNADQDPQWREGK